MAGRKHLKLKTSMEKYVISSGSAVVKSVHEDLGSTTVVLTNNDVPLQCTSVGEAMKIASVVNHLLGKPCFSIMRFEC